MSGPSPGLGACQTWCADSENRPQRGPFFPDLQPHGPAAGQKNGEKWTAAVVLQQTPPESNRLLDLLFEDDHLLVLNKPAGLLAVPGRGPDKQDCLSARAQAQWADALVVHRLDMATSGLVVMARGLQAQRNLGLAFEKRRVYKRYVAVVSGALHNPLPDNGWNTIELPLLVDWLNRPRSIVNHENGKPSTTRWRLSPEGQYPSAHTGIATRVELEPITGRSHQLRVHLQAIGHPIAGDPLYAASDAPAQAERLLLHAQAIEIPHPGTGERMLFESPCPF